MSLTELIQLEVTSVARKEQTLARAAAAVYVITREEIRRSGYRTVPELLRLAPGMHVAQAGAHSWAISTRGFNGIIANKMLVLVDGRSVYTPHYAGVYWELHDLMLEDIERIEVVRGPGGTMWGANAVNGVVNIITRSARSTQGGLVSAGGGTSERAFGAYRHGGRLGANAWYRIYGKYALRAAADTLDGRNAEDAWRDYRGGVRIDWEPSPRDSVTAIADASRGRFDGVSVLPLAAAPYVRESLYRYDASTGDLLVRWRHTHRNGSDTQFQLYYDTYARPDPIFGERRRTVDFEFQNRFPFASRHELNWGGGYRFSSDRSTASHVQVNPSRLGLNLYNGFVQDEIQLLENTLVFTAGTKFERNDFTGLEIQPSVRILLEPVRKHVLWGSVSRAVHTPSRLDQGSTTWLTTLPGTPQTGNLPAQVSVFGSPENASQPVLAWETGYRGQPSRRLGLDVAAFRNHYSRLRSMRYGPAQLKLGPQPFLAVPLILGSGIEGTVWGSEVAAHLTVCAAWKLSGSYTWLNGRLSLRPEAPPSISGESSLQPSHLGSVRSQLDLPARLQLDSSWYLVGELADVDPGPASPVTYVRPGPWSRLDLSLRWPVRPGLEISLRTHNSLDARHQEFTPELFFRPAQVRRGVDVKLEWRY